MTHPQNGSGMQVDVLLCTFRRPEMYETLASLARQALPPGVTIRVIVADNDDTPSARELVARAAGDLGLDVTYIHAPARNISIARNACLDAARADRAAFIDDDETASPGWLAALLRRAEETGADVVFGPVHAEYEPGAPVWMRRGRLHSSIPERRRGVVETGHTGNALLCLGGAKWRGERFDPALGRTGGEDTDFFYRLRRLGARFEIAEDAHVSEPVPVHRMRLGWLMRRRYRMGHSHAALAAGRGRARLAVSAAAKTGFCAAAALASLRGADRRAAWALRMGLHAGVVAGCLSAPQPEIYGRDKA